jgi:hypothetical protein
MSHPDVGFYIYEASIDTTCASSSWREKLGSKKSVQQEWLAWWQGSDYANHKDFFIWPSTILKPLVYLLYKLEIIAINNFERLPLGDLQVTER